MKESSTVVYVLFNSQAAVFIRFIICEVKTRNFAPDKTLTVSLLLTTSQTFLGGRVPKGFIMTMVLFIMLEISIRGKHQEVL